MEWIMVQPCCITQFNANFSGVCSMLIANGADPLGCAESGQLSCIDLADAMGRRPIAKRSESFCRVNGFDAVIF